jgi:molecular chaperone GrpE (heat shock protein)
MHRSAEGLELTSMDSSGSLARNDTSTGVLMNTVAELQKQNARLELAVARMAASEDNLQTRLQQLEVQVARIANSAM